MQPQILISMIVGNLATHSDHPIRPHGGLAIGIHVGVININSEASPSRVGPRVFNTGDPSKDRPVCF